VGELVEERIGEAVRNAVSQGASSEIGAQGSMTGLH
jgi:hypothetical protein